MLNAHEYIKEFKLKNIVKTARPLISHVYVYVNDGKPYKVAVRYYYEQKKLYKKCGISSQMEIWDNLIEQPKLELPSLCKPGEKYLLQYNQINQNLDVFDGEAF